MVLILNLSVRSGSFQVKPVFESPASTAVCMVGSHVLWTPGSVTNEERVRDDLSFNRV